MQDCFLLPGMGWMEVANRRFCYRRKWRGQRVIFEGGRGGEEDGTVTVTGDS